MSTAAAKSISPGLRKVFLSLGLVFGPLLFMSGYLMVTRSRHLTFDMDYLALGVSVAIGLIFIWPLSLGARARAFIVGSYLLLASLFLIVYSLYFVCGVFHDCL